MADAPSLGGGKIRSRRSTQARKPYSRANSQHKSLFSRVTDSFKSLLNPITPSWLTNRLNQKHGITPMPWAYEQTPNDAVLPSTSDSTDEPTASANNNYKQMKLARPAISTRTSSSSSMQMYITPPDTPKSEMTASLSGKQGLLKQLALNKKQQESLKNILTDEQTKPFKLVEAKAAVNDDASIASSSGCSSSMQTSQKTNTSGEDGSSQKNLWSASPSSQSPGKASRPCQQPTMSSSKRPRFNPSIFGVSAVSSPAHRDSLNSTFYNGPIQFGGANATARVPYFATPYKVPTVTKVKVHHVHQRTPRPKPTSAGSSKTILDDTMSSGMSSTARKILQTLEKMSSPLNDARRIPSIPRTPSAYAAERRNRRSFAGGSLINASFKAPPTAGLSTPYSAKVRKRVSMPLNNSLVTRIAQKVDEEKRQSGAQSTAIPDSRSISTRGVSAPIASLSSSAAMPRNSLGGSGGGKMKNLRKSTAHYSASHDELEEEAPNLPAVSLPLTGASNLPSFNFGKSLVTSTPAARLHSKQDNKALSKPEFNFASPVVKTTRVEQVPTATNTPQFQFSSPPTKKSSSSDTETPKTKPSANFTPGDKAGKSSLMFAPDPKVVSSLRVSKRRSSPSTPVDTPEKHGGGLTPAENLKIGSVMDVLGHSSKKFSDKQDTAATSSKDPAPPLGLLKQTKKGWECDTCLLSNNLDAVKCVACETPRPGAATTTSGQSLFSSSLRVSTDSPFSFGVSKKDSTKETDTDDNKDEKDNATTAKPQSSWGAAFKKPTGNWECGSCLVSNDSSKIKCVACETPKPGAETGTVNKTAWGSQFKKPSGSWECGTCLVSNDAAKTKCVACETPKPGAKIEMRKLPSNPAQQSQFAFGLTGKSSSSDAAKLTSSSWGSQFKRPASTWECEVCMVVNSDDRRTCQACESPKPGTEKEEKFNKSFKFGKTSPGLLKFSKPESTEPDKTDEKKEVEESKAKSTLSFGLSQKSDSSAPAKPTFSFGVSSKESTTSKTPQVTVVQSSSDKSDPPKIPTFNFGVTRKSQGEPTEKKNDSGSKPSDGNAFKPQVKFSFGAPDKSKETEEKDKEPASTFTFSAPPATSAVTGVSSSQTAASSGFTFGTTPAQAPPPVFGLPSSDKPKAPVFDVVSSAQSSTPFGSAVTTPSGFGPGAPAVSKPPLFGGFSGSKDVKPAENKPALPSFSFGNATSTSSSTGFQFSGTQAAQVSTSAAPQSAGFSFGSSSQKPAATSSVFGSGSQPSSDISTKPSGFTGFGAPPSNPPATQPGGFNFNSNLQSGSGSVFGTAATNSTSFGNSTKSQSFFGTSKPNSTTFGNNGSSGSELPPAFGPSSTPGSVFGTPNNSNTNAGLPKPSFSFGANTEQKAPSAFSGFNFNAGTPATNANPTGGSTGFAFGAGPNKPPAAFNPSNNAGASFQFGSPAPRQQQSNGIFKFGGSNADQSNPTTENSKSGMFVFGGSNKPETNSQQVAPVGFNFGAAPAAPTFNFGAPPSPQTANVFSAAPNQNPFSAAAGRSTTPVQGKRVIRQARRKLRK